MLLKEIPLKDIVIKENCRVIIDEDKIKELADSIKELGLQQPVGVYEPVNGKYEFRFGQRRILACRKLGLTTIMAVMKKRPALERDATIDHLYSNCVENLQRKNPTFPEYGRAISRLHDELKIPLEDIAAKLGKDVRLLRKCHKAWTYLPEALRSKVKFMEKRGRTGGGVGVDVAVRIAGLKKKYGLSKSNQAKLFKHVDAEEMTKDNIMTLGNILKDGTDFNGAIAQMGKYKSYYVEVIADPLQVEEYRASLGLPNTGLVLKRILYGECPPLDKPKFLAV